MNRCYSTTKELRNKLIENLLQVLGKKSFRNFDTHLRNLLVQDELYAEGKFANIPNQKKIFIADEIQRSAVTALVAAADKNQLLISEVGSGKIQLKPYQQKVLILPFIEMVVVRRYLQSTSSFLLNAIQYLNSQKVMTCSRNI